MLQVTFRFGSDTEFHYLVDLPSIGDRVAHAHELWVVTGVDLDSIGALVVCERPTPARCERQTPVRSREVVVLGSLA